MISVRDIRKPIKFLIYGVILCFYMSATAFAANYYVDPAGNDGGEGSKANPWASLSHACAMVNTAGDRIYVNPGTYNDYAQCVLARGVSIVGAGADQVMINTGETPYILAGNPVPVQDGGNDISGLSIDGGDQSGIAILSRGRSNQTIHHCVFSNFSGQGIAVYGKYGWNDGDGEFWRDDCTSSTGETCSWGFNNLDFSVEPSESDWAAGVDIHDNTFNDCKLTPNVLSGALIHGNTFNNDGTYGAKRSCIGNTSYWFKSCEIFDNELKSGDQGWSVIAIEMWEIKDNSKFYNNTTDSWFSLRGSAHGLSGGHDLNYQVFDNRFEAGYTPTTPAPAIEVMSDIQGVEIYRNLITGYAWEDGIAVWGADSGANKSSEDRLSNITIRNNVFFDISNPASLGGIHLNANQNNTAIENVRIINNIFDSNRQAINMGRAGGRVGNVEIKNNIFMNQFDKAIVTNGASFGPVKADTNIDYNNSQWLVDNAGSIEQNNTINTDPGLQMSGERPYPYYLPSGSNSSAADAGIGAYEATPPLPVPSGLRILG